MISGKRKYRGKKCRANGRFAVSTSECADVSGGPTMSGGKENPREWLKLESWKFTSVTALVREIAALLECSTYKLQVLIYAEQVEEVAAELDGWRSMGRVKVITV
jgi:hypothetical protein